MRMRWQAIMTVFFNPVMPLTRFFLRINMNNNERKVFEVVQKLVPDFLGD